MIDMARPWALFSSILIGMIGMVVFFHGKKEMSPRCLLAGAGLCVFPYFVASAAVMWGIAGGTLAVLYLTRTE